MANYPDREKDTQLRALQAATAALGWTHARIELLVRSHTPLAKRLHPLTEEDYRFALLVQDAIGDGINTYVNWHMAGSNFRSPQKKLNE